jgi:phage replication O-like protein O
MARPDIDNGFLRLANELAEALMRTNLNGAQFRIIRAVERECYGRNGGRKTARLSTTKLAQMTGLSLRSVEREVPELIRRHVLFREGGHLGIQKDYDRWNAGRLNSLATDKAGGDHSLAADRVGGLIPDRVDGLAPDKVGGHKKNRPKESKPKKEPSPTGTVESITKLPGWIPRREWDAWVEMRKKIRRPLTDHAVDLAVAALDALRAEGFAPADVLNQSTLNSWQGLFALREVKNGHKSFRQHEEDRAVRQLIEFARGEGKSVASPIADGKFLTGEAD